MAHGFSGLKDAWRALVPSCKRRLRRLLSARPALFITLCAAFVAATVLVTIGLMLAILRDRAIAESERRLQATAAVLAEQADRAFQALDLVEIGLTDRMEAWGIVSRDLYERRMSGHDIHLLLKEKISGLPHVEAVRLIGADGKLINSSAQWPMPAGDLVNPSVFAAPQIDPGSVVGEPVLDRDRKSWTIPLARKLIAADGEFLGLVLGTIRADYFVQFYQNIARGPGETVALFRRDGLMFARHPHIDGIIGTSFAKGPLFVSLADRVGQVTIRQISPADGQERLISGVSLARYPIVIAATTTVAAALAGWTTEAEFLLGLTLVLILTISGAAVVAVQHFRKQSIQLDTALNNMSQGLCMFDSAHRLIVCNARYAEMFGLPRQLMEPGTTLLEVLRHRIKLGMYPGTDPEEYIRDRLRIAVENTPSRTLLEYADGRVFSIVHEPMVGGGWVGMIEDVTERRRAHERITYLAHHDPLTELPNRTEFSEHLARTIESSTAANEAFGLLCLDLDRFKEVNDVHGHLVGDALLREVAGRLRSAARDAFVARLGGDEFTLIVGGPQPSTAEQLAARLRHALVKEIDVGGTQLHIGLSIGIAIFPRDGADATSLLANADFALYRAKADGRDAVRFFEPEMAQQLRERRELQHDLRLAAGRDEITLHYQPQAATGGEIIGFEALARWTHPIRGAIPPSVFIPLAEESGLIVALGEWLLREACRQGASWKRPLPVAVNLSPAQFRGDDLARLVHTILLETGLPPQRLELEITESVLIDDFSRAVSILRRLKSLGVRIALDDFGTGYSSLSYLQSFPFDKIKIDRTFIANLEHNPQSAAIIRGVIGLARGLDLPVVAEGVETRTQLQFLARAGCDMVQGFHIGQPRPIDDYGYVFDEAAPIKHSAAG
jgi:diguanylate cyclase (GGDEF)-like protein